MLKFCDATGQEAVVGKSFGYWLVADDFVSNEADVQVDPQRLGRLGFPRDWPAAYQSAAMKSLIGKRGRIPSKRAAVAGVPSPEEKAKLQGLSVYPLQSFSNAERAAEHTAGSLSVVRGWAVFECLDRPVGTAFVAERYWWNALPDGKWVDLTPRPEAWDTILLAEATQGDSKSKSKLTTLEADIAWSLMEQRFHISRPQMRCGTGAIAEQDPEKERGSRSAASASTKLPQTDSEWIELINMDAFPGEDAGSLKDGPEVKLKCVEHGFGGYVTWRGVAYLRRRSPAELIANMKRGAGAVLHLPAAALAAASLSRLPGGLSLPQSLPEVVLAGAKHVPKDANLSEDEMTERFINSFPAVLTDAQRGWPAVSKWTFEWLAEQFGDEDMPCSDLAPFFKHNDREKIQTVKVSMREFMRYVLGQPNSIRCLQHSEEQVFYANGWCPFGCNTTRHLLDDVSDRLYCVRDSIPRDTEFNDSLTKVFMGPAGTVSRLHHDTYATHVWLSQIRGRKQFIVWPPEDGKYLGCVVEDECDGKTSLFDPSAPDYEAYPEAHKAHAYSVVVEEGETVILPSRWFHWAKSLTPSITLMRNFVNEINMQQHMDIRQRADAVKAKRCQGGPPQGPSRPGAVKKEVIRPGDGKTFPSRGQTLIMHYVGTLASNGAKFDSSLDRGKPFQFTIGIGQVIRGWDEGVATMSLGEKARLEIASDYAYGPKGAGRAVPPNSDLIFEVELLKIEDGSAQD